MCTPPGWEASETLDEKGQYVGRLDKVVLAWRMFGGGGADVKGLNTHVHTFPHSLETPSETMYSSSSRSSPSM